MPSPFPGIYSGGMVKTYRAYTRGEEICNTLTHVMGMLFSVCAISVLVTIASFEADAWSIVSCSIFGASMLGVYTASSVYHAVPRSSQRWKAFLKKLDHIAIYYLIAGSYTPFLLVPMRSSLAWWVFGIIWGLALVGTALKIFANPSGTKLWSIGLYLAMGWLIIFISGTLFSVISTTAIVFLALGGAFYSFGVIFYMKKNWAYSHAIWHLFVLMGTVMHFFAVLFSCVVNV